VRPQDKSITRAIDVTIGSKVFVGELIRSRGSGFARRSHHVDARIDASENRVRIVDAPWRCNPVDPHPVGDYKSLRQRKNINGSSRSEDPDKEETMSAK
jgi:hypothetical protein